MADDWKPGDLALCVNDTPNPFWGFCPLRRGAVYSVAGVDLQPETSLFGTCLGLFLDGVAVLRADDGRPVGWAVPRFRRIAPLTEEERREALNELKVRERV